MAAPEGAPDWAYEPPTWLHPVEALIGKLLYADVNTERGLERLRLRLTDAEQMLISPHRRLRAPSAEDERRHIVEAIEAQFAKQLRYEARERPA